MAINSLLDTDPELRRYFDQETTELPAFFVEQVRQDLGPLWEWFPEGAMDHDPNAYLKTEEKAARGPLEHGSGGITVT